MLHSAKEDYYFIKTISALSTDAPSKSNGDSSEVTSKSHYDCTTSKNLSSSRLSEDNFNI